MSGHGHAAAGSVGDVTAKLKLMALRDGRIYLPAGVPLNAHFGDTAYGVGKHLLLDINVSVCGLYRGRERV